MVPPADGEGKDTGTTGEDGTQVTGQDAGKDSGKDAGGGTDDGGVDYKAKYEKLQADVNKAAGSARKDGRGEGAREREQQIADELGVSLDDAKQIIQDHNQREEANRSEAEKAVKRAEKAEGKLTKLEGAAEERDRYKAVVESYAESQREGLPESVQKLLDNLDPADQLEWLAENREEYLSASKEEETPAEKRRRKAEDTTPQDNGGQKLRGKARIAQLYSGR